MSSITNADQMEETAKKIRPFDFGVSFDAPKIKEQEHSDEVQEEPTFSLEDLKAAQDKAYNEGHAAATESAQNGLELKIAEVLEKVAAEISTLEDEQRCSHVDMQGVAIKLVRCITKKLLPYSATTYRFEEIENTLQQCLGFFNENVKITVKVHADTKDKIEEHFQEMLGKNGHEAEVNVVGVDNIGPSDCSITWGDGGAERNFQALWADIENILAKFETEFDFKNQLTGPHQEQHPERAELSQKTPNTEISKTKSAGTQRH